MGWPFKAVPDNRVLVATLQLHGFKNYISFPKGPRPLGELQKWVVAVGQRPGLKGEYRMQSGLK